MDLIKLVALDEQDLSVLSAHVQDAIVRVGDVAFEPASGPSAGQVSLLLRRFDWNAPAREPSRRLTALQFGRVRRVMARGVARDRPDDVLNLLAVLWEVVDVPSGAVTLVFSGDAALRLEVECVEARLTDLGPAWSAASRPAHEGDDGPRPAAGPA